MTYALASPRWIVRTLRILAITLLWPAGAFAQVIPPPTNPVIFCGTQALPAATSYTLVFDGGAPAPLTMDATLSTSCPAGATHSFSVPAARFTVGSHTLLVQAANTFGSTAGPVYTVTVGIAPGQFTITAVVAPGSPARKQ